MEGRRRRKGGRGGEKKSERRRRRRRRRKGREEGSVEERRRKRRSEGSEEERTEYGPLKNGALRKCKLACNILSMYNYAYQEIILCSVSLSTVTIIMTESYCNTTVALYRHPGGDTM